MLLNVMQVLIMLKKIYFNTKLQLKDAESGIRNKFKKNID